MSESRRSVNLFVAVWLRLFREAALTEGWLLAERALGYQIVRVSDVSQLYQIVRVSDVSQLANVEGIVCQNEFETDDDCEEYVASRDHIMHQLALYLQWRDGDDEIAIPLYWSQTLKKLLLEQNLEMDDICPDSHDGHHSPDWKTTIWTNDGDESYVDVNCVHCGRSGCVGQAGLLAEGINW
jgi:hypothetical protein